MSSTFADARSLIKQFPNTCVDNFYKSPDRIREFALSLNFSRNSSRYPGRRTEDLSKADIDFFDKFRAKLLALHYESLQGVECSIETSFQLVPPYSPEENSPKNRGWIHRDGGNGCLLSGIIYLTPNINKNCGTSLFQIKKGMKLEQEYEASVRECYYGSGIDDNYDNAIELNHDKFDETVTFYNIYNRLVSFDAGSWHAANSFYASDKARLTQVFFVFGVKLASTPLIRSALQNDL
jgi:hypothetical protein